jgi:hypothetical protein
MDHAIDSLEPFVDATFSYEFLPEWQSGKYKKFSDCPSYAELKALIDASNIMRKYIGWERLSIKSMLEPFE